jgi:hypothetical protein
VTEAPQCLLAARRLLVEHLDMHPGRHGSDLDPAEVGIVGDVRHGQEGSGYHLGRGQLRSGAYSVVESPRDRAGLSKYASAMDIGWFELRVRGKAHNLRSFSVWLVAQCKAGTDDTRDVREVIYSPDGARVKRWDRLGRRSTGDDSHLWHTHLSYFRDSAGRDKTAVFRRYLAHIGLIAPAPTAQGDDDMQLDDKVRGDLSVRNALASVYDRTGVLKGGEVARLLAGQAAILAALKGAGADEIIRHIDKVAAADVARDADLRALVQQAASGELAATEVVRLIGERLAASGS